MNKIARRVVVFIVILAIAVVFLVCMAKVDNSVKLAQDSLFLNFINFDPKTSTVRFRFFGFSDSIFLYPHAFVKAIISGAKKIYLALLMYFS